MHSLIMFLIKASSRNAIGLECGNNWGSYYFLFENKFVKPFVQCHVFTQSPPRRRRSDKYLVNISHRSLFVYK